MLDIEKIRADYPILDRKIYGRPLVYLDNTATSQTPDEVVKSVLSGYTQTKANPPQSHGVYQRTFCRRDHLHPRNH